MNRRIDIKAILSHLIKGDGLNKCRICMGETTDGQVYLGDTVMMDEDKPITLLEIMETITGLQVEESRDLPPGVCSTCTNYALSAWQFRRLCSVSTWHWSKASSILPPVLTLNDQDKVLYIFYNGRNAIKDCVEASSITKAVGRLNSKGAHRKAKRRKKIKSFPGLKCNECGKIFSIPQNLNEHIKNSMRRVCTECCKVIHKTKLARHLQKFHNKTVHPCEICHQLFDTTTQVVHHKLVYHNSSLCQCKVCGSGFKSERSLRAHMYAHTLFDCPSCNTSFENRQCYIYHRTECTGFKSATQSHFECDDCGQRYDKKPSLKMHIVQKHLAVLPYVCQVCGKRSSTLSHQKAHVAIHLAERQTYQCYCGAKMRTRLGFKMHQRIHSGEKPYECAECGERFLSASRRLDHVKRRHSNNTAHVCAKCGAKFIRPFELKKHQRSIHFMDLTG